MILHINAVEKHLLFLQNSVRKHLNNQQLYHIMLIVYWIWKSNPAFNRGSASLILVRVARSSGITMHCLVFDFIAIFTLHNAGFSLIESIYHQVSHQKTDLFGGKTPFPKQQPQGHWEWFFARTKMLQKSMEIPSIQLQSACLSRMSFVNWLCSLLPSSLPRFNSATVECVLRGYEFELFEG